jgi:hypothetical protein
MFLVALAAIVASMVACPTISFGQVNPTPLFAHIVVVVEENHSFSEIIGNPQAPYINSLASAGVLLTNYNAITHPSEPNYFALYAGSTFGIQDDGIYHEPDPTLATILQGNGESFIGYVESGSPRKHNPWESFPEGTSVESDMTAFPTTDFSQLPKVSFVIPNLNDDMHDGTIAQGDQWLKTNIDAYGQWAVTHNSLLIVVWDEDDGTEGNRVPAILYGANIVPGSYNDDYTHYDLLHTLLSTFGLPAPNNSSQAAGFGNGIFIATLRAAVLPASRSVQVNGTATAFATVINTGSVVATDCGIAPAVSLPGTFVYQTTDPRTNAPTGTADTGAAIASHGSQSYVVAFIPTGEVVPIQIPFYFSCSNAAPAPSIVGLNTLLFSASTATTPDVIALAATLQNDGIAHVTNGSPPTGVFAVASDNLGSSDSITVGTNTGSASLPITVTICQTNSSGQCLQTPSATVATTIAFNATPTFGIFVSASSPVTFDPANKRIFVTFTDSANTIRGETSVAVDTQ